MNTARRQTIDVARYLASAGPRQQMLGLSEVIFSQGDPANSLIYVLKGLVTLSVSGPRRLVAGIRGAGDCIGDESLFASRIRTRTATALTPITVLTIDNGALARLFRARPAQGQQFLIALLARGKRVEEDLIDQLQTTSEQRLARTLLLLGGYGLHRNLKHMIPSMSQTTLASIVGTTRSRTNALLQKFKRGGFIDMNGSITVHRSLLRAFPSMR